MSSKNRQRLPHRSVILVASAVAFSLLGDQALYAILPIHFKALGLFPIQVGIILSANRWIRMITNHLAERVTARVDTKWVMPLVLLVSALICVVYGSGYPFPAILGARLLWGLCWSFLRQIGIMTSVNSTVTSGAGKAVGYYTGISRIGSIAGCFIGALLFDIIGYRSTFMIFGILTLLGIPLGYASQKSISILKTETKPKPAIGKNGNTGLLVFFGFVVGCAGPGLVMSTLGFILKDQFGGSISTGTVMIGIATINGILLASRHIIGTLGAPFFGTFVDWIGYRKGAFICFAAAAITLFIAMAAQGLVFLLSMILLFFISAAIAMVLLSTQAATHGSRVYASFATALDLGAAVGPLFGWTILEFISIPTLSFAVGGFLYAAAMIFSIRQLNRSIRLF
jgi:predicted MFS family arabinose efflux permease